MTLSEAQKDTIRNLVKHYAGMYNYEPIPVDFTVTGRTAGVFRPKFVTIGYNEDIAARNYEAFIARTVPHEVAHYIDFMNNGGRTRQHLDGRRDMHGKYFRAIMVNLGVTDTKAKHNYTGITRKKGAQRRWEYDCGCQTHSIATVTHNRIQKGASRICKTCKNSIKFTGKEIK